jgi:cell division protein FtsZ
MGVEADMGINIGVPGDENAPDLKPRITVLGVGGAGGNAVNNMIASELQGVDFVVANTDAQALIRAKTDRRVQLGADVTEGLGAGSRPDVGRIAAEESLEKVMEELEGAHMVFIAAGMGGGTGTGAAPVIAKAAKERGILTVAVVTKPFQFEGSHRMRIADAGIQDLESFVDTLIIIPNQNLFRIANESTTFADAFGMADEVLYSGVRGVTDLMTMPGLINLDFADIRSVMGEMGKAMMGTGEANGERRSLEAAEAAINNPLLDDSSMKGARGVLINITGGMDITLFEVDEAANRIRSEVDQDAHIIIGSAFDKELDGIMRVSVVATGIDSVAAEAPRPQVLTVSERIEPKMAPEAPKAEEVEEAPVRRVPAAQSAATSKPEPAAISTGVGPQRIVLSAKPAAEVSEAEAPKPAATDESAETKTDERSSFEIRDEAPVTAAAAEVKADVSDSDTAPAAAASEEKEEASETLAVEVKAEVKEEKAPAATPNIGATDAFIPKPAAAAAGDAKPDVAESADPMAEAALVNGGKHPAEPSGGKSKSSLFELVTGTGKAAINKVTGSKRTADAVAPAAAAAVSKPDGGNDPKAEQASPSLRPMGGGSPAAISAGGAQAAPQQALGGLEPEDRIQESSDEEEDLLDIPAFLRRQAN